MHKILYEINNLTQIIYFYTIVQMNNKYFMIENDIVKTNRFEKEGF